MRYSSTITAFSLLSSAFAITVTTPSSDTVWDFTTPKTIRFTSDSSDPSVVSIILRSEDGSFQVKLADNVKTSAGEYTTQPDPSISNGDDYEIQIIDSAGQLAVSDIFTVEKGASDNGTTASASTSSSSSPSTSSSSSSSLPSSFSSSSSPSSTTANSASVTSTLVNSASSTTTLSTSSSSFTDSKSTSSSATTSSGSPDASSTTGSASGQQYTGAAPSQSRAPMGAMTLLGAAFALFYV